MLTVVLRYGLGQRQRLGLDFAEDRSEEMEVDGVKAMVAGVKSRGVSLGLDSSNRTNTDFVNRAKIYCVMSRGCLANVFVSVIL